LWLVEGRGMTNLSIRDNGVVLFGLLCSLVPSKLHNSALICSCSAYTLAAFLQTTISPTVLERNANTWKLDFMIQSRSPILLPNTAS